MVGNDVVDLGDREVLEGPAHPGFDARVFTPGERDLLAGSRDADRTRWTLWAAKEAAFKLARKLDPSVVFSPRRFKVLPTAPGRAQVLHSGRRLAVRIAEAGKALHAVAFEPRSPGPMLLFGVEALRRGSDPSRAARALAARALIEELGVRRRSLRFGRRGRVPTVRVEGSETGLDVSFSHHGRFVAFACQLETLLEARLEPAT